MTQSKHFDYLVVGSGISGLTMTLLLARQNYKVLLLEKAPYIGGSLKRFYRHGVPFDVGFHFTGGLHRNGKGMFDEMLRVLDMDGSIEPRFTAEGISHRIAFPEPREVFEIPAGLDNYRQKLKCDFPGRSSQIDTYFEHFQKVCENTGSMSIQGLASDMEPTLDEDFITLQTVLDQLFPEEPLLQTLLSSFCMCHGSRPDEISFADHTRLASALYESTARIKDGGDALIRAFQEAFRTLSVEVRCKTEIKKLAEIKDRRVNRFILSDGEEVTADYCCLTIHPHHILELLPRDHTSPAFRHRVEEFSPSTGFFSIFGTLQEEENKKSGLKTDDAVFSIFPGLDMNKMMRPEWPYPRPLAMLANLENTSSGPIKTMTAFELSLYDEVRQWENTSTGRRGADYLAYKQRKSEDMLKRLAEFLPELKPTFQYTDSASMLTFRDYLNSPYGAAYGIKQKTAQFNLAGKLPLVNLYAAGQSAILPGVLGAMASAFFIFRYLIGKPRYQKIIEEKLCP